MAEQPLVIPAAVRAGTRRRRLALGIALVALVAGGLAAYRLRSGEAPVAYRSVAVERRTIVRVVEATGRVEVLERVEIPAPPGPVLEIRVKAGDRVTRGQA
ncbi:MAG: hypothetical protein FJ104_09595, partial [Deltaproteobacteria bacterium]|nr:hypothetical protein [Deltaproteobacteria bacterium]